MAVVISRIAAGCGLCTARKNLPFRPADNSLFSRHLTHTNLLCTYDLFLASHLPEISFIPERQDNHGYDYTGKPKKSKFFFACCRKPGKRCYCSHVHSNKQKSMKIAFVDGIFAHWPSLTYGQRSKCADLCEQ